MNASQLVVKDYMWYLIKDATCCILEKIEFFSKDKIKYLDNFSISYKSSNFPRCRRDIKINFEIYFKNLEDICAVTEKFNNKNIYIKIYLPASFGIEGLNKYLSKNNAIKLLQNKEQCIIDLVKVITHEVTHAFDPLFYNKLYTEYYKNKNKIFLEKRNTSKYLNESLYFDSVLERNAHMAELEAFVRICRNQGKSKKETADLIKNRPQEKLSCFESFIKNSRSLEWKFYIERLYQLIEFYYSDPKFLLI